MPRLFIGLDLPDEVDAHLELLSAGVPGARWQGRDRLHLTLRFLDDLDGRVARLVIDALARVRMPPFSLTLRGIGVFPPRGEPTSLWIGVDDPAPLQDLRRRIDRALDRLPVPADPRKFAPHVTLARLKAAPIPAVVDFMGAHALTRSAAFRVERFFLYSSILSDKGSKYRIEAGFPLAARERLEGGDAP